jgi:hypothetical protein
MAAKKAIKRNNSGKTNKLRFVDQSSGKRFSDDSSSGSPLSTDYILKQDFAQWLHDDSGKDKIIGYAFGEINGPFTVGDGYWDNHDISSVAVSQEEKDYITGQLNFLSGKIGIQFFQSSFEDADIRFFAAESGKGEYTGFATVDIHPLDLVWERAGEKKLTPNIRLTISHEIAHGLGLEHVDEISGLSEKEMHKRWGVSDSLMISWEKPGDFYDTNFPKGHQWFSKNDLDALSLAWSRVV